jgi:hypothetical protein
VQKENYDMLNQEKDSSIVRTVVGDNKTLSQLWQHPNAISLRNIPS